MTEKRRATRNKCFLRGSVYVGTSLFAVSCIIRDISDTGARLIYEGALSAADIIDLHIPIKGQRFHARVQWRNQDQVGIAFVDASVVNGERSINHSLPDRIAKIETDMIGLKQIVAKLRRVRESNIESV